MDLYRVLSTPVHQYHCPCDRYIKELFSIACPELPTDAGGFDLAELMKYETKIFFPSERIREFVTDMLIEDITRCSCFSCTSFVPKSTERSNLMKQVRDSRASASLIVANLIYLRETRMLYEISKSTDFRKGIDAVTLPNHPVVEKNFSKTKALFNPPMLRLGDTESRYESGWRLPFVNEKRCGAGSFGVVTRFEIHEDYIDEEVRELVGGYMSSTGETMHPAEKLLFARKTIQGARNQSLKEEVDLERDVLAVIAAQTREHKEHLIDLIAFYTFGDEINLVFPFVEGNLENFLCGKWQPLIDEDEEFSTGWIARGILGMAEGLKTIHDPPAQPQLKEKGKIIGFHFDLKPANILITRNGTFKITDFGQALIKLVNVGESTSDGVPHLGGDPRYAPPEDMPTREQVKRSSQLYKYSDDTRSLSATPELAPSRPPRQTQPTSSSHLEIPVTYRQSQVSLRSGAPPQDALGSAKYDIWSLARVMLEILTHSCLGGSEAVERFQAELNQSGAQGALHTGQGSWSELKGCVQEQLIALKQGPNTTAPRSSSMQTYMDDSVELMRSMLDISEKNRPDAESVAAALDLAAWKFKMFQTDKEGLVNAIRGYDTQTLGDDLYEVAIDETRTSFLDIEGIYVQDFEGGAGFLRCRIRIYANKPTQRDRIKPEILLLVAFKRDNLVEIQQIRCLLEETYFSPLYLYAYSESSWADCCRLKTKSFDKKFWFKSKETELLSFQAILFQYVVEPDTVTVESSPTERSWSLSHTIPAPTKVTLTMNDYTEIELRPHAVQIWTARHHTPAAPRLQSQATSISTTSSGQKSSRTRLVLFLRSEEKTRTEKHYDTLQVALEPRLGVIKEGGHPHEPNTPPTSLILEPTGPNTTNGVFAAILSEVCRSSPKAPNLPLNPELYKRHTNPSGDQRTRGIKIYFHPQSAKNAIETIKRHFEAANKTNKPRIAWIERTSWSDPRRRRS